MAKTPKAPRAERETAEQKGELVWSDEFDDPAGSPPNPSWWTHETGGDGWGNGELQHYTSNTENASHDGQGNLCIRAMRSGDLFSSARLLSKGRVEFQYGRLESRVLLPLGRGLWSAVWLLGANIDSVQWPACGEIDVMENIGAEPTRVFGTVHCPEFFGGNGVSGDYVSDAELAAEFRIFSVDWTADRIAWSVDDQEYFSVSARELGASWVFDHPFYLVVNLAVGGSLGGDVGAETEFPAQLKIDYVRIYGAPQPT